MSKSAWRRTMQDNPPIHQNMPRGILLLSWDSKMKEKPLISKYTSSQVPEGPLPQKGSGEFCSPLDGLYEECVVHINRNVHENQA
jgi:hypothetical protein